VGRTEIHIEHQTEQVTHSNGFFWVRSPSKNVLSTGSIILMTRIPYRKKSLAGLSSITSFAFPSHSCSLLGERSRHVRSAPTRNLLPSFVNSGAWTRERKNKRKEASTTPTSQRITSPWCLSTPTGEGKGKYIFTHAHTHSRAFCFLFLLCPLHLDVSSSFFGVVESKEKVPAPKTTLGFYLAFH
jgi:hypothetical protein